MVEPKISIITINYNNRQGLQKTIQSIFCQTYLNYEHIVIDGGSTDGSLDYISKHIDKLSFWSSEKDEGIYSAMNKGIRNSKGEYIIFLNSGDYFFGKASLDQFFMNSNNEDLIYGNLLIEEDNATWMKSYPSVLSFSYFLKDTLPHPSTLIKRSLFSIVGLYNEKNRIVSDWEFFVSAICKYNSSYKKVNSTISVFKLDGISSMPKNSDLIELEKNQALQKHFPLFLEDFNKLYNDKNLMEDFKSQRLYKLMITLQRTFLYKLIVKLRLKIK